LFEIEYLFPPIETFWLIFFSAELHQDTHHGNLDQGVYHVLLRSIMMRERKGEMLLSMNGDNRCT
jgi:hypothetical protein